MALTRFSVDNGEEATKYVKERIGRDYRFSAKPVLRALWDNYNECQYVDDTGEHAIVSAQLAVQHSSR